MKILIVEDDAAIRLELARFLEKYGYTCLCPADFTGIAAKAAETQPDLALLDINLPCQDGFCFTPSPQSFCGSCRRTAGFTCADSTLF